MFRPLVWHSVPNSLYLFFKSSHPVVFLGKGVLKICGKFTGEHPCRSAISIKLQSNFIEITLRHGCSPVNLLHIFRTPFSKNTFGRLLLIFVISTSGVELSPISYLCNIKMILIRKRL